LPEPVRNISLKKLSFTTGTISMQQSTINNHQVGCALNTPVNHCTSGSPFVALNSSFYSAYSSIFMLLEAKWQPHLLLPKLQPCFPGIMAHFASTTPQG